MISKEIIINGEKYTINASTFKGLKEAEEYFYLCIKNEQEQQALKAEPVKEPKAKAKPKPKSKPKPKKQD